MVIQETPETPSTEVEEVMTLNNVRGWMVPTIKYFTHNDLPEEEIEVRRIKRIPPRYLIILDQLYKKGRSTPMLRCISEEDTILVMKEVHEGVCGSHIRSRALSRKILRAGYYWPTVLQDCA